MEKMICILKLFAVFTYLHIGQLAFSYLIHRWRNKGERDKGEDEMVIVVKCLYVLKFLWLKIFLRLQ